MSFAPKPPGSRLLALIPAVLLLVLALLFHARGPVKRALLGDRSMPAWTASLSPHALLASLFSRSANSQHNPPAAPVPQAAPPSIHSITVKFNYDFTRTPACTPALVKKCVEHFDIYDISSGRTKLFALPVPPNAKGLVQGITGESPRLTFESGKHLIGVSAVQPDGVESDPRYCTLWVDIEPPSTSAP